MKETNLNSFLLLLLINKNIIIEFKHILESEYFYKFNELVSNSIYKSISY